MLYMKIDPDFKKKWVAALRSGKYEQTPHALRSRGEGGVRYCCLGVGCELTDSCQWREDPVRIDGLERYGWSGLVGVEIESLHDSSYTGAFPFLPSAEVAGRLAEMNDAGRSFAEIGDWIEENL